jgi:hypothetical protein
MTIQEQLGRRQNYSTLAGLVLQTDEHIIRASVIYLECFTFQVTQEIILDVNDIIK